MLVLITYDVNIDGGGGEAPPSERGEAVRCARTTGAELGF